MALVSSWRQGLRELPWTGTLRLRDPAAHHRGSKWKNSNKSNRPVNGEIHRAVPILPLRDTVIFPQSILPLAVGRDSTVRLLNENGDFRGFHRGGHPEGRDRRVAHRVGSTRRGHQCPHSQIGSHAGRVDSPRRARRIPIQRSEGSLRSAPTFARTSRSWKAFHRPRTRSRSMR